MKKLDRLVIKEMLSPWAFGVAMFTVLIMAGSFLFELTRYLSEGVNPLTILKLTAVLLPGIMAKTFPMAVLLSGLLSFGRLSGDSEIVAMRAAGVSVARIMAPVAGFGIVVTLLTFWINEQVVPVATAESLQIKTVIEGQLKGKTAQDMSQAMYQDQKLKASFWAADFDFSARTLSRVVIVVYNEDEKPTAFFFVDELRYNDEQNWELKGGGIMVPASGGSLVSFEKALPTNVPKLEATPEELLAKRLSDLDALPMQSMGEQIDKLKKQVDPTGALKPQISNLEFGYWNKLTLPLAALIFGLVGAPLGIRSHRVAASAGFWQAVIIIFVYMIIARAMAIAAQGGRVPASLASFLPIIIGLIFSAGLIRKRDTQ